MKEQKKDLKLFLQAGQDARKASTWAKLALSVSTWSVVQHTGPVENSAPQTCDNKLRALSSSGYRGR